MRISDWSSDVCSSDLIGAFLAEKCRKIGLEVEVIEAAPGRPNVVATWDNGEPGPTLLLNDHPDTFPPGPIDEWTHHPYAAEIVDGRIYGRGSIDPKQGLTPQQEQRRVRKE